MNHSQSQMVKLQELQSWLIGRLKAIADNDVQEPFDFST